jgi:BirA family biotin operon repressor/biotin-[acetyl-CoA-carboxylase] ligase
VGCNSDAPKNPKLPGEKGTMNTPDYIRFPGNTRVKYDILYLLLESQGRVFSWDEIAGRTGITVEEAKRNIQSLLDEGFSVITASEAGCTVSEGQDSLSAPGIYSQLRTQVLGRQICYTLTTASTNDDARVLAESCPDGTLVICETQTKGKGRLGRQWESPRGGIFMSLILKPEIQPARIPPLALVAGYATARALERAGLNAAVKWPNDVLVQGRKLAGILCEISAQQGRIQYLIVGIGINANIPAALMPPGVRERSTSVLDQTGKITDRNLLIAGVLNEFEPCYLRFLESGLEDLIPEIEPKLAYVGSPVMIHNTALGSEEIQHGILQGLDSDGSLLLSSSAGEIKRFAAGDLSLRPK